MTYLCLVKNYSSTWNRITVYPKDSSISHGQHFYFSEHRTISLPIFSLWGKGHICFCAIRCWQVKEMFPWVCAWIFKSVAISSDLIFFPTYMAMVYSIISSDPCESVIIVIFYTRWGYWALAKCSLALRKVWSKSDQRWLCAWRATSPISPSSIVMKLIKAYFHPSRNSY